MKSHKKIVFSMAIIAALMFLPSVFAQDYADIDVSLQVEQGQFAELTLDGCWINTSGETWEWSGTAISLKQPGDRESGSGTDGDAYNWYDVYGGDPNGNATITDTNTFAYGDCRFDITIQNYSDYALQLYGTDFESLTHEIPDMVGSTLATFDFALESEDPDDPTHADKYPNVVGQGEHGFFIVNTDIDTGDILQDTGYGATSYSTPKKYDATDCADGSARPCYHMIPEQANAKSMVDENAGDLTNVKMIIRQALGASNLASGDYSMTTTMVLNTSP